VKRGGAWGKGFDDISLNAGDTIVFPDKSPCPAALRGLIGTSQIFEQLALDAAAMREF
jgi:hypothetical protein